MNRFQTQTAQPANDGVVEPDPRVVMAVLAVGVICGALLTSPSNAVVPSVPVAVVEVGR